MNEAHGNCPFEEATRASRCQGCYDAHGVLTPCVTSWLRTATADVIPVADIRDSRPLKLVRRPVRRAA